MSDLQPALDLTIQQIAQLDEARQRIADLEAALRPFATYGREIDGNTTSAGIPDACPLGCRFDQYGTRPNLGDCRRAAELLRAAG